MIAIHTFGEYLDFHLHSNALVADGLFDRQSKFYVMRVGKDGGDTRTKISPLEGGPNFGYDGECTQSLYLFSKVLRTSK